MLRTGIPREMPPQERGCGAGMTCRRRLREWHKAGVWERLPCELLNRPGEADRIDGRGIKSRNRLGRHRWGVERMLAWLNRSRRLTLRDARRADVHHAFLIPGCALICFNPSCRFC